MFDSADLLESVRSYNVGNSNKKSVIDSLMDKIQSFQKALQDDQTIEPGKDLSEDIKRIREAMASKSQLQKSSSTSFGPQIDGNSVDLRHDGQMNGVTSGFDPLSTGPQATRNVVNTRQPLLHNSSQLPAIRPPSSYLSSASRSSSSLSNTSSPFLPVVTQQTSSTVISAPPRQRPNKSGSVETKTTNAIL